MAQLVLCNVHKVYRSGTVEAQALRGVDLTISAGEYVAVSGPSGSGKSTLLSILGCLENVSSGRYLINDEDVTVLGDVRLSALRASTFGFVFQGFHLLPELTALKNVMIPMRYGKWPRHTHEKRARMLLERVGLSHRAFHTPAQLSGGEQQRVAIARALANDPSVILADEPTGNLDSKTRDIILNLLEDLASEGQTLIVVSHDQSVIERAKRRIALLDGCIVEA